MGDPRHDAFPGCLIGQCVGDALGFIVEGQLDTVCRRYVDSVLGGAIGSHDPHGRIPDIHRGVFPFGQYSDDSQLAREMLISFRERGAFDPADYAKRIADLFARDAVVGGGRATRDAAARLAAGVPWTESGAPPPEAGNGSAMRAAPIGLMFHRRPAGELVRAASEQSRITHADSRCAGGSVAIAGAVRLAMTRGEIVPRRFLGELSAWVAPVDDTMADALARLADWITLPPERAVSFISRAGLPTGHRDMWVGISPYVVGSVLWALYAFLRSPDDFRTTLTTAVTVGGDVDTTGAMAGAISGARNGLNDIPWGIATRLNDQGAWTLDHLTALAEDCRTLVAA